LFTKIPVRQANYQPQAIFLMLLIQSHLTTENNLKVEKRYIISKTSTTFLSPDRNAWGLSRHGVEVLRGYNPERWCFYAFAQHFREEEQ